MKRRIRKDRVSDKQKGDLAQFYIIAFLLGFFGLLFLLRINPPFFTFILALFLFAGLSIYLFRFYSNIRYQRAYEKTTEGMIEGKLTDCQEQINRNESEIEDIQKSISEIEMRREHSREINPKTLEESERLIQAFEQEMQLREAKITFYRSCYHKLLMLRDNHNMVKELAEKQEQLKKLQEGHYEELANMEALKTNLAYDTHYLTTIDQLSTRMLESRSLDTAQELQLELNVMTKELKKL
ncbi:MAG: hypothetical protein AAGG75_04470 [Bacteroidota bacterium]